jgi:hypothetical protein
MKMFRKRINSTLYHSRLGCERVLASIQFSMTENLSSFLAGDVISSSGNKLTNEQKQTIQVH